MLKFITHRPLWLNIVVGILLAVGIFSVFVLSLTWLTHHNESMTVPQVIGKTFDEAESILDKAGFEIEIQDSIYSDTARPNVILKQFPEPDEIVKVNRKVFLTINRTVPPLVEMPNLLGYSIRNEEMTLKNAGLKLGDTSFRPDFAKNAVLEQSFNGTPIQPGTKVRMGSRIDFVLGSGVGNTFFAVPDLVGKTYAEAKAMLESNGIGFASIIAIGISDTMNAFIYQQRPERYNDEKKLQHIRPGQTMDIWLQTERPVKDSTGVTLPEEE